MHNLTSGAHKDVKYKIQWHFVLPMQMERDADHLVHQDLRTGCKRVKLGGAWIQHVKGFPH